MAEPENEVDLTDENELEIFIKESGLDTFLDAMKKPHRKPKKVAQNGSDIDWILEIIRTFQPVHLQLKSYYVLLVKLLDYLTKEEFSGCLFIHIDDTISVLSMWRGELTGIINNKLDITDEEALRYVLGNYQSAVIDIYQSPEGKGPLPLIFNSIAKKDLEPKYKDLDTEFTDLPKLISKMEGDNLVGYIELKKPESRYIACYHRGEEILAVHLDKDNKHTISTSAKMCKQNGIVNIYQSKVRTLVSSMEDAMKRVTVLALIVDESQPTLQTIVDDFKGHISLKQAESARNNVDLTISMPAGLANRDDSEIFKVQVTKTPEFEFARYLLGDYFLNIAETGNNVTLKNIWVNIPRVKVIKFAQTYHEGHVEHKFDVVIEDGSDNVLFAARITNKIPKSYEVDVFVKELENIKENKNEWNSLRAGFLISTKGFEDDAISAAVKETGSGAGVKKVLGKVYGTKVPDVLTNPIGFVKTGNGGGFHLGLIHLDGNSFKPIFPEL
ncbi:MAG: hypothetical protein KAR76_04805 [Methanosarcinales archaeon]|nr:hypothetical protein [Methanosarcinales archaeon]